MKKSKNIIPLEQRLTINTAELMSKLGCGYYTALQIGDAAHARITVGRLVFWNLPKINEYLNSISE